MGKFIADLDCIRQRDFVNIPAWHKAGYTGKGLTVFMDDKITDSGHVGGTTLYKLRRAV